MGYFWLRNFLPAKSIGVGGTIRYTNSCRQHRCQTVGAYSCRWGIGVYVGRNSNSILIRLNILFVLFGPNVKLQEKKNKNKNTMSAGINRKQPPSAINSIGHTAHYKRSTYITWGTCEPAKHVIHNFPFRYDFSSTLPKWNYWKAKSDQISPFFYAPTQVSSILFISNFIRYQQLPLHFITSNPYSIKTYIAVYIQHIFCCIFYIHKIKYCRRAAQDGTHVNINILFL